MVTKVVASGIQDVSAGMTGPAESCPAEPHHRGSFPPPRESRVAGIENRLVIEGQLPADHLNPWCGRENRAVDCQSWRNSRDTATSKPPGWGLVERLDCSPPTEANPGSIPVRVTPRFFARGKYRARRCRWSAGFFLGQEAMEATHIYQLNTLVTSDAILLACARQFHFFIPEYSVFVLLEERANRRNYLACRGSHRSDVIWSHGTQILEPCPHSSGVGWPTCSRRVAGSCPGASDVADAQLDCRTGNSSTNEQLLGYRRLFLRSGDDCWAEMFAGQRCLLGRDDCWACGRRWRLQRTKPSHKPHQALAAYRNGNMGYNECCRQYGIPKPTLRRHLDCKNIIANDGARAPHSGAAEAQWLENTIAGPQLVRARAPNSKTAVAQWVDNPVVGPQKLTVERGRGGGEFPDKTRRPATSPPRFPHARYPDDSAGSELGSPKWRGGGEYEISLPLTMMTERLHPRGSFLACIVPGGLPGVCQAIGSRWASQRRGEKRAQRLPCYQLSHKHPMVCPDRLVRGGHEGDSCACRALGQDDKAAESKESEAPHTGRAGGHVPGHVQEAGATADRSTEAAGTRCPTDLGTVRPSFGQEHAGPRPSITSVGSPAGKRPTDARFNLRRAYVRR
ncbi:hypothetical protein PR048_029341 [Dryococelus australis]|uniref:HTH psq-type domain-containing protein n=1 Tax=Dryococelus australis TaxID=614101 RepID=A0ABQ9GD36_9NEOP|nr:hypothetical protein PR048_029341 [Dryococelus australis]